MNQSAYRLKPERDRERGAKDTIAKARAALRAEGWDQEGIEKIETLMQERGKMTGKRAGVILSGGNIDMPKFADVLEGKTPAA